MLLDIVIGKHIEGNVLPDFTVRQMDLCFCVSLSGLEMAILSRFGLLKKEAIEE